MGGADEEWVVAAMSNDTMVVELLVRLHGEAPPPPPPVLSLEWTVRQRRSRPISVNAKKLAQNHRASPSTPLSWSGGTSLSGGSGSGGAGGGGSEESSRPLSQKLSSAARSKFTGKSEKSNSKRSRKKKTLAQLKDEENSLLKERRDLKRGIAALRINLEKQIAQNEKLKRIKTELQPLIQDGEAASTVKELSPDQLQLKNTSHLILPDLNMPFEEACTDVICSVS